MTSVPELSSALSPWRKDVVKNKESTDEPDIEDFQSTNTIRAALRELPSPIMIHEVVSVEPSTVLDEACPVSNDGSHSTDETPTSPGGISKSPTRSRLSGIGKAGETTGEENEENYIGTTNADSTQDPRHIIVTFNGEQLPIEVESSKTLFDLRKEILDRRIPEDGNFFFLLGKNVISKKLEKRHLIDDILENNIPVSLTSRSFLEEAVCYVENAVELVTPKDTLIRHNMFNDVGGVRITCTCSKSRCLKLYCDCFQQSRVRFL